MGEITEMILEGILCEECGAYIEDSLGEFPQKCEDCKNEKTHIMRKHKKNKK